MTLATMPKADPKWVERSLEQHIKQRTGQRLRHLHVAKVGTRIVMQGVSPSFYVKQLALQAVRDLHNVLTSQGLDVQDEIDVCQDHTIYANEWSLQG
jgi:hypothetical protein